MVDWHHNFGIGVSSTSRLSMMSNQQDAASTSSTDTNTVTTLCYECHSAVGGTTIDYSADFVSLDALGFTINWGNAAPSTGFDVYWIAFGGTDLTNIKLSSFASNTITGSQQITGVGFQPDTVLFFYGLSATNISSTFGYAKSSTARNTNGFRAEDVQNPNDSADFQRTDNCIQIVSDTANSILDLADFTSLDTDGFTINWGTNSGVSKTIYYLALKGGQFQVSAFNQATSTGNQSITDTGFQPVGVLLSSFGRIAATTISANSDQSIGIGISSTDRRCIWAGAGNAVADSDNRSSQVLRLMTSGTPTTEDIADYVSNDAGGFTVNWSTADAVADQILYWAFGNAAGGATTHPGWYGKAGWF